MFNNLYYGWWIVFACFMNAFYVAGIIFYGFTAFVEPLVAEFGWSYAQISFAASLRGLEMGILAPLVGFLVDRFGSRRLLLAGVIFVGCGIMLLGITHSLPTFYASFLLIAFGAGGCTSVVTMTAVANWFDKNVGKAMGVMASGFGASGLMVPLIVWLIATYGWRKTTFILGLGMWVFGIPLSFILRERPEGKRSDLNESPDDVLRNKDPKIAMTTEIGFKTAVRNRSFLWANLSEVVRMMCLAAVVTHIMPYLNALGVSRSRSGIIAASVPLLSIFGRFAFGWLGDFFEKRRVMAIAFISMGLGMLSFAFADTPGFIYLFLFFFSSGFGGLAVLRGALLREYFGRHSFGKLMGILMGAGAMGGIIGPTLAGLVFDRYGTYSYIWLFLCAMIGVAVLLILKVEPRQKLANTSAS
jgi:MFS family permease